MNKHQQHHNDDDAVYHQAYNWVVKLQTEQCSEQDHDAFLDWIENAEHANAFSHAQAQYNDFSMLKNDIEIASLIEKILANPVLSDVLSDGDDGSCIELNDDTNQTATANKTNTASKTKAASKTGKVISLFSNKKKRMTAAMSVGFSVAASLLIFTLLPYFTGVHHTGVGEIRTFVLEDGTKVMLDTQSTIRVAYSDNKRMVYLRSGRAHFNVAKNPNRPFTVQSDNNAVTAVGTEFSVNNVNKHFIVRLNEGVVDIQSESVGNPQTDNTLRLHEGEQWLALNKMPGKKETLNRNQLNWMKGSLVFEDAALNDVIAEINRYSDIKIQLANQQLANTKINAVFHMGKTTHFASALQSMLGVDLNYDSDGNIVLSQ